MKELKIGQRLFGHIVVANHWINDRTTIVLFIKGKAFIKNEECRYIVTSYIPEDKKHPLRGNIHYNTLDLAYLNYKNKIIESLEILKKWEEIKND